MCNQRKNIFLNLPVKRSSILILLPGLSHPNKTLDHSLSKRGKQETKLYYIIIHNNIITVCNADLMYVFQEYIHENFKLSTTLPLEKKNYLEIRTFTFFRNQISYPCKKISDIFLGRICRFY